MQLLSQIWEEFVISIFSEFVRTNSITGYYDFLEFVISNLIRFFQILKFVITIFSNCYN